MDVSLAQLFILCFLLVTVTRFLIPQHAVPMLWRKGASPSHPNFSTQCLAQDRAHAPDEAHETWDRGLCLGCLGKKFPLSFLEATWREAVSRLNVNEDACSPKSCWQPPDDHKVSKWRWHCRNQGEEMEKCFCGLSQESLFKVSPKAGPTAGIFMLHGSLNFIFKARVSQVFCY